MKKSRWVVYVFFDVGNQTHVWGHLENRQSLRNCEMSTHTPNRHTNIGGPIPKKGGQWVKLFKKCVEWENIVNKCGK